MEDDNMSLMLRQACEEPLSRAGLGNYHAGIESGYGTSKDLALYSNCGQLFLIVPGITFGSIRLKTSEVAYSAELLDQWLKLNRQKIDRYLAALENREVMKLPENIMNGPFQIRPGSYGPGYGRRREGIIVEIDNRTVYSLDKEGNVTYVETTYDKPQAVNKTVIPSLTKAQIKRIEAWITQYFNAKAAEKQLEEAREALSESCALV
jgi:hypothetical protein